MKWKQTIPALTLVGLLGLSGCSAMLERSWQVVTPHPEHPVTADDADTLRAETYQDLVNDVLYFVKQGIESGSIRLVNYTRDVEADLNNACLEVAKDAPLGAYAVDYIEHDSTRVVEYYEARIRIGYRRTPEQIKSIKNVTGSGAIRQVLQDKLGRFAPEAVLQVAYFAEDEAYIASLIRQTYYDTPAAALGMPDYTVTLYPADAGQERIVEILLTYPEPTEELRTKSQELLQAAGALLPSFQEEEGDAAARAVVRLLRQKVRAGTGPTAYDALIGGEADSEGMALAFQLLCQTAGLDSQVVQGTLDGMSRFWNVFAIAPGRYAHVDPSAGDAVLLSDASMTALGYVWDQNTVPNCI